MGYLQKFYEICINFYHDCRVTIMSDNEKLIKKCDREIRKLQQIEPIDLTDADLSWCDADTRDLIVSINDDINRSVKARINQLSLIRDKLKSDGDV